MVTTIEQLKETKVYFDISGGHNCLSNYAFNFDEYMRDRQFAWLNGIGPTNKIKAVEHILSTAEYSADGLAKALNDSNIGYTNWVGRPIFNAKRVGFVLECEDTLANRFLIFIITHS